MRRRLKVRQPDTSAERQLSNIPVCYIARPSQINHYVRGTSRISVRMGEQSGKRGTR